MKVNPDSQVKERFAFGIQEATGFWIQNTAPGIRNPTNDWNLEFSIHQQGMWDWVPGFGNPHRGIQNPRLSWITLHEAINFLR